MMMASRNRYNPGCNTMKPCCVCHKRHVRANEAGLRERSTASNLSRNPLFKLTTILAMFTFAAAHCPSSVGSSIGSIEKSAELGAEFVGNSRGRMNGSGTIISFHMRRLQEEEHLEVKEEEHSHKESEVEHVHEEGEEHVHEENDTHDHHDHDDDHDHDSINSELHVHKNTSKPWGQVIGATLIVNLTTLTGLLLLVIPAMHHGYLKWTGREHTGPLNYEQGKFLHICIPGFAVGALMATAVFLVFPEAVHLIGGLHEDHNDGDHEGHNHRHLQDANEGHDHSDEGLHAAQFGMAVLGGFLIPVVLSIFFGNHEHNSEPNASTRAIPKEVKKSPNALNVQDAVDSGVAVTSHMDSTDAGEIATVAVVNKQLCASILVGDAFHNFGDGVFIGAAFLTCSSAVAVSIVIATVFHEMAQELADFILLTQTAGLPVLKATALNFISGLSVVLGGVVVLAGAPSDSTIGIILAVAGGVYVNIAANETLPRIQNFTISPKDKVVLIFSFIIGAVPIGLILLDHEHCG